MAQTLTDQAVTIFDEFLKLSPDACNELVSLRVKASKELADHPTIQVAVSNGGASFKVGILGLVNGILEAAGHSRVAASFDNDKLVGFTKYVPPKNTP